MKKPKIVIDMDGGLIELSKWEFIDAAMKQEKVGYSTAYFWWKIYSKQIQLHFSDLGKLSVKPTP